MSLQSAYDFTSLDAQILTGISLTSKIYAGMWRLLNVNLMVAQIASLNCGSSFCPMHI